MPKELDNIEYQNFLSFFNSVYADIELWVILKKNFTGKRCSSYEYSKLDTAFHQICQRLNQFSTHVDQCNIELAGHSELITASLASINLYTLVFLIKGQHDIFREYFELYSEVIEQYTNVDKNSDIFSIPQQFHNKLLPFLDKSAERSITINKTKNTKYLTVANLYSQFGMPISPEIKFYDHCFEGFHPTDYWRLFVDGRQQINEESGWIQWEYKEPGSVTAMHLVWEYTRKNCQSPHKLSEETLKSIHKIATSGVSDLLEESRPGEYRKNRGIQFGIIMGGNASLDGVIELMGRVSADDETYKILTPLVDKFQYNGGSGLTWKSGPIGANKISKKIDKIISDYNAAIEEYYEENRIFSDGNLYQLLRIIISCVKSIELLHPFWDGNCRTCYALLNLLLLQNKLPPTIMHDPNRLDGFTVDELIDEVIEGMETFFYVKSQKCYRADKSDNSEIKRRALNDVDTRGFLVNQLLQYIENSPGDSVPNLVQDNTCRAENIALFMCKDLPLEPGANIIKSLVNKLNPDLTDAAIVELILETFIDLYHLELISTGKNAKGCYDPTMMKLAYCYEYVSYSVSSIPQPAFRML